MRRFLNSQKNVEMKVCKDLTSFLVSSQRQLKQANKLNKGLLHVVIGNEAADADSIISALVYAHFLHLTTTPSSSKLFFFLPLISIPRNQLALRCESMALFNRLDLPTSAFTFLDEINWQQHQQHLQITLTDHNELSHKMVAHNSSLSSHVCEILDHHMDSQCYLEQIEPNKRVIAFDASKSKALVGSCCTLIAEKFQQYEHLLTPVHATLLLGAILLDTANLNPKMNKVTDRDVDMSTFLEKATLIPRQELFDFLQREKFNAEHWQSFSIENCLQYDFKKFSKSGTVYGISAVLIPIASFLEKADRFDSVISELKKFSEDEQLDFLMIMSMVLESGSPKRQILLFSMDNTLLKKVVNGIISEESLNMESLCITNTMNDYTQTDYIQCFRQNNSSMSRKQMVPVLMSIL